MKTDPTPERIRLVRPRVERGDEIPAGASSSPLAHSRLQVHITDLLAEYELRHVFRNQTADPIEAVYSFPIPLDAAFLGLEATLNGDTRTARVIPARKATREYDDAISEGYSAVLLEQVEPGMLCVNLGNMKPGTEGEVVLRFVSALSVAEGAARFSLPLVHRPRYGRCRLDEVTVPLSDFAVEHPLDARIVVEGLLADCPVQCASEGARFQHRDGAMVLELGPSMMDRDLVLGFTLQEWLQPIGRRIADGSGSLGAVTVLLPTAEQTPSQPRDVCLLLDCSGSMNGDAIEQTRKAVRAVADCLQEHDRIQVLRFGSRIVPLFRRPLRASTRVQSALHSLSDTVRADLGGTEMGEALGRALDQLEALEGGPAEKVVVLVTDGAVTPHQVEGARARAIAEQVRVFTVAVGSSAGVDILEPLARDTGAVLERAVPAEPIDAAVLRQFRRARSGPIVPTVDWGVAVEREVRPSAAYPGDAVTFLAWWPDDVASTVTVSLPERETYSILFDERGERESWRRWAAMQACSRADAGEARRTLALQYGLLVPETKAVLVHDHEDAERVDHTPTVVRVPHMVSAGRVASAACASYSMGSTSDLDLALEIKPLGENGSRRRVNSGGVRANQRPSLTVEERTDLAELLAKALVRRDGALPGPDALLGKLPEPQRARAEAYVADRCSSWTRRELVRLLKTLIEGGVTLELRNDDDEAELAVILG